MSRASLVAQLEKNLPAMQEIWIQFLGWEDPLEKEVATTPVSLPGESHGQRSLAAIVHGVTRVGHYLAAKPLRMELPKAGLLASKKDKVILREELFLRKFSGKR